MVQPTARRTAPALFDADETAWLEATAALVRQRCFAEVDTDHLAGYLHDMAQREYREVLSRLTVLLLHLLKWEYQPDRRSGGWEATIFEQRDELADLTAAGSLRNHAVEVLDHAYDRAVKRAVAETGLPAETFPTSCPFALDDILSGA